MFMRGLQSRPPGPPRQLKVFAPDGTTKEFTGWFGYRNYPEYPKMVQTFIFSAVTMTVIPLNPKVVVFDTDNAHVIHDPRYAPLIIRGHRLFTRAEIKWLLKNTSWPNVLELYDNPVEPVGEENEDKDE